MLTLIKKSGFTIVELMIIIIVVGILAGIVSVSFNGYQQRTRNTARISDAKQAVVQLRTYRNFNNALPTSANTTLCLTQDNVCTNMTGTTVSAANTTLMNELAKVGTPVKSTNTKGQAQHRGILYDYHTARYVNGRPAPLFVVYFLEGVNQDCKNESVVKLDSGTYPAAQYWSTSSTKYTDSVNGTTTRCFVSV